MKKILISFTVLSILLSFPIVTYADSFTDYNDESLNYPKADIPSWSLNDGNKISFVAYNSYDECFYYFNFYGNNNDSNNKWFGVVNGYFIFEHGYGYDYNYHLKKYNINSEDFVWQTVEDIAEIGFNRHNLFAVSRAHPFKIVWVSGSQSLKIVGDSAFGTTSSPVDYSSSVLYTITNDAGLAGTSGYIYADFWDNATGEYLHNDSNSDSGSGDSGGTVINIDMSGVEQKLEDIKELLSRTDTYKITEWLQLLDQDYMELSETLSSFKSHFTHNRADNMYTIRYYITQISDKLTTINTNLTTQAEAIMNVIVYGNTEGEAAIEEQEEQLDELSTNLDTVIGNINDVDETLAFNMGGISSYVATFSSFYTNTLALNVGLTAILEFGLFMILMKKVIGR